MGIFTNPYKRAKEEGVVGFFKGLGTGLLGAFLSPITAILKIGNSLIVGLKNTVSFNKGKLITFRYRHPRFLNITEPLKEYQADYAEVKAIIKNSGDNSNHKIIYFHDFIYSNSRYEDKTSTLIITDKSLFVVYDVKDQIFNIRIIDIENVELHNLNGTLLMLFETKDKKRNYFMTDNLSFCSQTYSILEKLGVAKKTYK